MTDRYEIQVSYTITLIPEELEIVSGMVKTKDNVCYIQVDKDKESFFLEILQDRFKKKFDLFSICDYEDFKFNFDVSKLIFNKATVIITYTESVRIYREVSLNKSINVFTYIENVFKNLFKKIS